MDKYRVFGNPIEHSKSPQIHQLFANQTGEQVEYEKQLVAEGGFAQAADGFFRHGGKGLNVTVPFKLDAFDYADQLTARAKAAGAVNTLAKQVDGTVLGDNTDGIGLVADIVDLHGWPLTGKRVLILGAGGAVRGVIQPLMEQKTTKVVIANRTIAKALQLVKQFRALGKIQACGFADLQGEEFDVIINGTSASLSGELPPLPEGILAPGAVCYDMMYGAEPTVFMRWAMQQKVEKIADGLGMLVGQAAASFNLWRGKKPDVQAVIDALRKAL